MTSDKTKNFSKRLVFLKIFGLAVIVLSTAWGLMYEPWYISDLLEELFPSSSLAYGFGCMWSVILRVPIIVAGGFLWAALDDIGRGYVFTRINVRRLITISKLALLTAALFFADGLLFDFALKEFNLADLSEFLPWLLIAGGSMTLSVIMEQASELKEENDLTV